MMKTMGKQSSKHRAVLATERPRAKKSLGQNFLMHARTGARIVKAAALPENAVVFEIGPGTGMLTRELLATGVKVIALEADLSLFSELQETFADALSHGQLELVHGDIRTFPVETLPEHYHVVANIPYYLTGEIIRLFLESSRQPESMTLLVQKEVAERIARTKKKENLLSLSVKVFGEPKYEFTVPRGAFMPPPSVDSAVLSVRGISRARFHDSAEEQRFFTLMHAGFAHKRKMLAKNLETAGVRVHAVPEKVRAEDLSLDDWFGLLREEV